MRLFKARSNIDKQKGLGILRVELLVAMGFRTHINLTRHRAISKYSYLHRKVASKLSLIQYRVFSKLHYLGKKKEGVSNSEIHSSTVQKSPLEFFGSRKELTIKDKEVAEGVVTLHKKNPEITDNCLESGQVTKIKIIGGKIVEKEYITLDGEIVLIKF